MKTIIPSVKGTRDFYPENMAQRSWLYQKIRQVSEAFGYQEYEAPFLEKIDLYAAKSGEELVKEQSFVFPDRGGELIALRPEMTPSLTRMVAQRQNDLTLPMRWWSFGPFWRYEKPQKGRSREFFQWNIDLIGAYSAEADAEMIAIAAAFFKATGLTPQQVIIKVNNRRMMNQELENLGILGEIRQSALTLVDRRDKLSPVAWDAYALEIGLTETQLAGLKALLADACLWQKSPELVRLFGAIQVMGLSEYVRFDPQIIRGLAYYTGNVFEAYDVQGEFRTILGGGRYDNLVSDVGGEPMGGVGFAMGDMVISLVLEKFGVIPNLPLSPASVLVTIFDEERLPVSLAVAAELRQAGLNVNGYPEVVKLPKQLKFADRMDIRFVVIIGPDEAANGLVTIKDLKAHSQQTAPRIQAAETIQKMLATALPS
jgi:histidyl-tRNA synthetase